MHLDRFRVAECDCLKNGNMMHMTNKISQGGESRYRLRASAAHPLAEPE